MKHISLALAGMFAVSLALPAAAGPDWTVIRAGETHKSMHTQQAAKSNPQEEAVPLDHGPRALSTPWLNQEHQLEAAALAHKPAPVAASPAHRVAKHA